MRIDPYSPNQKSIYFQKRSHQTNLTNRLQRKRHLCRQCYIDSQKLNITDKKSSLNEDLFQWSEDELEQRHLVFDDYNNSLDVDGNILSHSNINDSMLDNFPAEESTVFSRSIHAPGDVIGHIDLINGQKRTETSRCITNTLVRR